VQGGLIGSNYDTSETTSVLQAGSGGGCVDWCAVISAPRCRTKTAMDCSMCGKTSRATSIAVSGLTVALPNANKDVRDIFVEVDYLSNLDSNNDKHSHLPKQAALDTVGDAFAAQSINVHSMSGPTNYQGDSCLATASPHLSRILTSFREEQGATQFLKPLCFAPIRSANFPNKPAIGWKGGLLFVRDNASVPGSSNPPIPLGNFQPGTRAELPLPAFWTLL